MRTYPVRIAVFIGIGYLSAYNCFAQQQEYPVNTHSSVQQSSTGKVVFDRLNRYFEPLECNDKSAHIWLKTYTRPKDFSAHLAKVLPLLDYVSRQFERSHLPSEYALVPFIESRYNPSAKAKSGPGGLWQMIKTTAVHLGIKVNEQYDGRYSPVDSTRGAIRYFTELDRTFSGWHTILMAYNTGSSRLRNAMKKQNLKTADTQKKLPTGLDTHTYVYVQKIQAIACLIAEPARYSIALPNTVEFMPLQTVELGTDFSTLKDVGNKLNIPQQVLIDLNPSYRHLKHSSSAPGFILVPNMIKTKTDDEGMLNQSN